MSRALIRAAKSIVTVIAMTFKEQDILFYLVKNANENSWQIWKSLDTMSREIGCSKSYLEKVFKRFRELGLMHTQHRYWTDTRGVKHRTSAVHTIHIPTIEMWLEGYRYDGSTRKSVTVNRFGPWEPQAPELILLEPVAEEEIESPIEQVASTVRDAVAYVRSTSEERAAIKEARARKREKRMNARKRERILKAEAAMQARARNGRSKREIVMACMPQGVGVEAWNDTQIEDMYQLVQTRLNIGWMHVEIASILSEGMPSNVHNMFAFLRFRMENKINPDVSPAQQQEAARKQAEEIRSKQNAAVEAMLNAEEDAESRERSRLFDMFYEQVRCANPGMSPRRVGAAANILVAEHLTKTLAVA